MIDVAFIPSELESADVAVVVDVLRATTTVAAALAAGHERVLCCQDVETAERLREPGRLLAGERECVAIPGFDRGNSPLGFEGTGAGDIVLSTTNGSRAIVAAAEVGGEVVLASLANLEAVLEGLPADGVAVVCAGTDGGMAIEDVYLAGLIVSRLEGEKTDAALIAARMAASFADHGEALNSGSNARVLRETDQEPDIEYCARESILDVVPRVTDSAPGVATVSAGARGASAPSASIATSL
ncbi:MAG TPA: 2-phosphosulfolactate phosphatase [Thermoleophilaceae bacterium]|nr:2-phosphosulfolactate phosphatase [Thermoleophilaceae bacterium]